MNDRPKTTAIIIDDMTSIRAMAKAILGAIGVEVVGEAENGALGLTLFQETRPDLVLLDIDMPVKDGVSTLKSILARDATANVVMMTTVSNQAVVESCILGGAKDYITKDKDPMTVKARLEQVIAELSI
ncbi:MAG: response regulator [Rhodospirillales bacterium]|jgi:two-component system, chemotaxis family, chemotaxis protein CheY|nr:response regulator [Rhodospirillales bacterium]MBT4041590.1 response regulator [Rhodospirillales bacterium]MBT4627826.1 response regulator [Rhodospirillales bacterium]MBT5352786.1 response regulator [Rhodospirillales bacterium]MBT5521029.1 response regulator [Rhodospirillales bacterium]